MSKHEIGIIGAAYGLGGRSIDTAKAPQCFRDKGLLTRLTALGIPFHDYGDLQTSTPKETESKENPKFLTNFRQFGRILYERTLESLRQNRLPLILGGDHSISVATVAAATAHTRHIHGPEARLGLLWVDAHADINTPESSQSHALHGMSAAVLLGNGPSELVNLGAAGPHILAHNLSYIGLRDLDPPEKIRIRELGIQAFTMKDIDKHGIGHVVSQALRTVTSGTHGFCLSFDLDVCDPNLAPGVTTPVRGGITFRESHLIMEMVSETNQLAAVEVVEYNPSLDREGMTCEVALSIIESALGKSIL